MPTASDKPKDISQLLLHYLKTENVKYLFGIPGAAHKNTLYTLKLNNYPTDFKYITCLHEAGASYIAAGYYRATGRPGVVLVTSGPGATNALTGAVSAQFDGSAVITISGEPSEEFIGRGYLQEGVGIGLNIQDIYEAAVAHSAYITNPTSAKRQIERALRKAMSTRRNAVHLAIPNDIAEDRPKDKECNDKDWPTPLPQKVGDYRTESPGVPSEEDVAYACDVLTSRNRPLIFLGSGCRDALRWGHENGQRIESETYKALRLMVQTYHIPVITSMDGKGLFPETDELSLGGYGPPPLRWPRKWFREPGKDPTKPDESWYDALLVIGSSLGKFSTDQWNGIMLPCGPFIQVDIDPDVIQRAFVGCNTRGIVADAGKFIMELWARLEKKYDPNSPPLQTRIDARKTYLKKIKPEKDLGFVEKDAYVDGNQYSKYPDDGKQAEVEKIEPPALIKVLQEAFLDDNNTDTLLFIDSGNCVGWGGHYFKVAPPNEWHSSLSVASMGVAVAGVIGARLGINQLDQENPTRKKTVCLALVGDGAFLMHANEILGARLRDLGAIWIVLKDLDLLMVTQGQNAYAARYKKNPEIKHCGDYALGNAAKKVPDFVKISEGYGADAYEVTTLADLKNKVGLAKTAAQSGMPQVIAVNIDRKKAPPYPHLLNKDPIKHPTQPCTQEEFEQDKFLLGEAIEQDSSLMAALRLDQSGKIGDD